MTACGQVVNEVGSDIFLGDFRESYLIPVAGVVGDGSRGAHKLTHTSWLSKKVWSEKLTQFLTTEVLEKSNPKKRKSKRVNRTPNFLKIKPNYLSPSL